jgi:hypothetical protein
MTRKPLWRTPITDYEKAVTRLPKDIKDEAAPTTREFCLSSQPMDLKADAMRLGLKRL